MHAQAAILRTLDLSNFQTCKTSTVGDCSPNVDTSFLKLDIDGTASREIALGTPVDGVS